MRIPKNVDVSTKTRVPDMVVTRSVERQTPEGPSFSSVLKKGAKVLAKVAGSAIRHLPGGEIVSAAVTEGVNSVADSQSSGVETGVMESGSEGGGNLNFNENSQADLWKLTKESQKFNLFYLQLQEELSKENRRFTALSNVLKARHKKKKNAINNIR